MPSVHLDPGRLTITNYPLRSMIARQFLTQGLRVAMLGCIVGLGLAAALGRTLSGKLYGVTAVDLATLGGVVAIVLAVSTWHPFCPRCALHGSTQCGHFEKSSANRPRSEHQYDSILLGLYPRIR